MLVAVSLELGKTADWIAENMTLDQVGLYYSRLKKFEYEYQENQAKLVWLMMNGWSTPKDVSLDTAKEMGILKDTV